MNGLFGHVNQSESTASENEDQQGKVDELSAESSNENEIQQTQSSESEQVEHEGTKYSVGIDLGTTHCVLSYVDLTQDEDEITQQVMAIPQLTAPGVVEDKKQLP